MIVKVLLLLFAIFLVSGFKEPGKWKRSLQPGTPNIISNNKQPRQIDPRNDNGRTNAGATIQHHGPKHDLEAGWSKVVRGPNKAKPSWHVGGSFRWRRSINSKDYSHIDHEAPFKLKILAEDDSEDKSIRFIEYSEER